MNHQPSLAHFAAIPLDPTLGMGRIALHWRDAFIRRGWNYIHYGTDEVKTPMIKALWGNYASRTFMKSGIGADLNLAHEPSAQAISRAGIPTVLFSHGLEECGDKLSFVKTDVAYRGWKNYISRPFWARLARQRRLALRNCPLLLLSNQDDQNFVISQYARRPEDTFVFRNGVNPSSLESHIFDSTLPTVLFYGSWLERKGKSVLIKAATKLARNGINPHWLLIGTGKPESEVLSDWPLELQDNVSVIPRVNATDDDYIYNKATVFVLPSFFEGQPLTLLQAMECGRCVISTRCCGQKDIISHGNNGFLFEPGNSDEFAQLIADALSCEDLRVKVGLNAKLAMKSRLWRNVADEVVDRLQTLL